MQSSCSRSKAQIRSTMTDEVDTDVWVPVRIDATISSYHVYPVELHSGFPQ